MKFLIKQLGLCVGLGITASALLISQHAMALGTDPGTTVSNTATVSYAVNGNPQPDEVSNNAEFVVDRRVDFTVTRMGAALTPTDIGDTATDVPAASNYLDFYVTNLSNGDLDFNLAFTQLTAAAGNIYGAGTADDTGAATDMTNVRIRVSSALDPAGAGNEGTGPEPGLTDGTFIDNLPEDRSIRVRIYADTASSAPDGSISGLSLDATAANPADTVDLVETPGVDDPLLVENVFANASGGTGGPPLTATESANDGFLIRAAELSIDKAANVIFDPFGSGKALPGAIIEYTITIDNSLGSAEATSISISDLVDADVTFVADAYNGNASNVSIDNIDDASAATYCLADAGDGNGDGCEFDGTTLTLAGSDDTAPVVVVPIVVPAGDRVEVKFQVLIPAT